MCIGEVLLISILKILALIALEVLSGRETMDPRIAKEHETYTKKTEDVTNKASCSSLKTVIPGKRINFSYLLRTIL